MILIKELNSEDKSLFITGDEKLLIEADLFIVTVPTPVDNSKKPNLNALKNACLLKHFKERFKIKKNLESYKLPIIVFESTVFPGATEEICIPIIREASGLEFNTLKKILLAVAIVQKE